jgi:glycosyltransferase involved in cell wall biosynthesis
MAWLFWSSLAFLAYTFFGYSVLLWIITQVRSRRHQRAPIWPTVTVIITAHNEERQIGEKIRNTLELRYPADKRQVIVASDGSSDGTVDIVRRFADRGVELVELPERRGKHHAQMLARDASRGEILVFTDASIELEPGMLERLVSNFADPAVGCVSTEDKLVGGIEGTIGEGLYVRYEMWLRRLESEAGSLVSASGSCFAARHELCDDWRPGQSSDFFIPLHAVARKMRAVIDPECRARFGAVRRQKDEFQRKVRTIVHGLNVFFTHLEMLQPLRHGLFSWQFASHKLCRWLVPLAALTLLVSNVFLRSDHLFYRVFLLLQCALYAAGLLATLAVGLQRFRPFRLASFFVLGTAATLVAWVTFASGETFVSWEPSRRT